MTCADARAEPPVISAAPTNISRKRFIIPPIFSQARLSTPCLPQVLGFFLLMVKTPAQGHCFERLVTILKALYRNVWLCKLCSPCAASAKLAKFLLFRQHNRACLSIQRPETGNR